jgi:hypothetical protein
MEPIAGECVLIADGRRVSGACAISIEEGERPQAYGFLSAPYEALKQAQLARRVQVEFENGHVIEIQVLQIHQMGMALIALDAR